MRPYLSLAIRWWYEFHMTPIRSIPAISHRAYHDICEFNWTFVQNWNLLFEYVFIIPREVIIDKNAVFHHFFRLHFQLTRLERWTFSGLLKQNKLLGQHDSKDQIEHLWSKSTILEDLHRRDTGATEPTDDRQFPNESWQFSYLVKWCQFVLRPWVFNWPAARLIGVKFARLGLH